MRTDFPFPVAPPLYRDGRMINFVWNPSDQTFVVIGDFKFVNNNPCQCIGILRKDEFDRFNDGIANFTVSPVGVGLELNFDDENEPPYLALLNTSTAIIASESLAYFIDGKEYNDYVVAINLEDRSIIPIGNNTLPFTPGRDSRIATDPTTGRLFITNGITIYSLNLTSGVSSPLVQVGPRCGQIDQILYEPTEGHLFVRASECHPSSQPNLIFDYAPSGALNGIITLSILKSGTTVTDAIVFTGGFALLLVVHDSQQTYSKIQVYRWASDNFPLNTQGVGSRAITKISSNADGSQFAGLLDDGTVAFFTSSGTNLLRPWDPQSQVSNLIMLNGFGIESEGVPTQGITLWSSSENGFSVYRISDPSQANNYHLNFVAIDSFITNPGEITHMIPWDQRNIFVSGTFTRTVDKYYNPRKFNLSNLALLTLTSSNNNVYMWDDRSVSPFTKARWIDLGAPGNFDPSDIESIRSIKLVGLTHLFVVFDLAAASVVYLPVALFRTDKFAWDNSFTLKKSVPPFAYDSVFSIAASNGRVFFGGDFEVRLHPEINNDKTVGDQLVAYNITDGTLSIDGIPHFGPADKHGAQHYINLIAVITNQAGQPILFIDGPDKLNTLRRYNLNDSTQGYTNVPYPNTLKNPLMIAITDRGNGSFYAAFRSTNTASTTNYRFDVAQCTLNTTDNLCIWSILPGLDESAKITSIVYNKPKRALYITSLIAHYPSLDTPQYVAMYDEDTTLWHGIQGSGNFDPETEVDAAVVLYDGEPDGDDEPDTLSPLGIGLAMVALVALALVILIAFAISKYRQSQTSSPQSGGEASQGTGDIKNASTKPQRFKDEDDENDPHPL